MRELSRRQGADAALTAPSQNCAGTLRKPHAPQPASLSRVLAMRTFSVGGGWGGASDTGKGAVCHHQLLVPKPEACPSLSGATGPLCSLKQSYCYHVACRVHMLGTIARRRPYSRVRLEVPVVDGFDQLLRDFDDFLLPC